MGMLRSTLLYVTIDEELMSHNLRFFYILIMPTKVNKVVNALYGLHQAPKLAAITPKEPVSLTKDEEASDVDVHLYRSYYKVTPNTFHLNAVKRIFKYLKGKPNLGLWYPRESPFDLEAFSYSDYVVVQPDMKSHRWIVNFLTKTNLRQCNEDNNCGYFKQLKLNK
ncbi:hypothetical protein Tco_1103733 [Tanacetum coccineum]